MLSLPTLIALAMSGQACASVCTPTTSAEVVGVLAAMAAAYEKHRLAAARVRIGEVLRGSRRGGVSKRRRVIERSKDKWIGSTLYGYVYRNAEHTDHVYKKNFRMTSKTVDVMLKHLQAAGFFKDGRSTNPHPEL